MTVVRVDDEAVKGMEATFPQLLALYHPRVHRAALGMLGDEQEAREVAQEALLKAWAARSRYDSSRPFYPWLYTIVRNACRDALARRSHRAYAGLDTERLASARPNALALLDAKEARQRVRRAMDRLRPEQREILAMRHFQDLSYAEIGQLLEIPQGTVMSRIYRSRKALLRLLEEMP